ncbi:MAG: CBS domain-containing protein [Planctomycetaceae bacterium]|nr:CBS domain-containing protein [Planctomycetaceae bacterium]
MICPHCGTDNIDGIDACEACGQSLTVLQEPATDLERSITQHPVRVLVPKRPVMVSGSVSIREAVQTMVRHRIGCLLIEDDGTTVGIFTERDVLNRVLPDRSSLDRPVREMMTPSPESICLTDSLAYAMHAMSVGGYRHLPVAGSNGEAAGIISARDLLRFLSIRFADIRDQR